MDGTKKALTLLPLELRTAAEVSLSSLGDRCEQIHLRCGERPCAFVAGAELSLDAPPVTEKLLRDVLERASGGSYQTAENAVMQGYLSVAGGLRIGLCGTAVMRNGAVMGLRDLSSLCIRIPAEHIGCADGLFPELMRPRFISTLVFSPPGGGKTSLLRELIRRLSGEGLTVSVADERGELAGRTDGCPGFDVGRHTDVMSGMPKAEAARMLIRSMSPQVLAMDEIGTAADAAAIDEALCSGAAVLASAHAGSEDELRRHPVLGKLPDGGFRRLIAIRSERGARQYEVIGR